MVSKRFKGGELGIIVFLDEYINFEYEISPILLDENEIVNMYGTKWFGIESVIKVIPIFNNFEKYKKAILKELSTLGGLSHPNIIKLFCCYFSKEKKIIWICNGIKKDNFI